MLDCLPCNLEPDYQIYKHTISLLNSDISKITHFGEQDRFTSSCQKVE